MRKIMLSLALFGAIAPLAACKPDQPANSSAKHKLAAKEHKLYHFKDGRTGYQDDSGGWWFILFSQSNSSAPISSGTASRGSSLGFTGNYGGATFVRGDKPPAEEIEEATEEEVEGVDGDATTTSEPEAETQNEPNDPASEPESAPADAPSGDTGDTGGGGGDPGGE